MGIEADRQRFAEKLQSGELKIISESSRATLGRRAVNLNFRSGKGLGGAASRSKAQPKPEMPDILALTEAAGTWARSKTSGSLDRAKDIRRDKLRAVGEFFAFIEKDLPEVRPPDVRLWIESLEARGLAATTIYSRCCHLSSFFRWIMEQEELKPFFRLNPVKAALPKFPKPYESEHTRALDDASLKRLWAVMEEAARTSVVGLRDYSIFLFFVSTGDRRAEIARLRGQDIILDGGGGGGLTYYTRRKGGERSGRRIEEADVARTLVKYIKRTRRMPERVFGGSDPLWLAHDRAKKARKDKNRESAAAKSPTASPLLKGAAKVVEKGLTSRAFDRRMKLYAERAGVPNFHLHQFRHTVAVAVAEETGSLREAQEMLGHRSMQTTRTYVPNITVRGNAHSSLLKSRVHG